MKLNIYRKIILALFSISIFISCILYVPCYNGGKYQTIFSGAKIDFYKLLMEIFVLIIIFGTAFLFTGKISNPNFNDKSVKKIIKREILLFLVLLIVYGVLYLIILSYSSNMDYETFNFYVILSLIILLGIYPLRLIVYYIKRLIIYLNS